MTTTRAFLLDKSPKSEGASTKVGEKTYFLTPETKNGIRLWELGIQYGEEDPVGMVQLTDADIKMFHALLTI